jgi:thiol-disulfide isomerase/thioredoxin
MLRAKCFHSGGLCGCSRILVAGLIILGSAIARGAEPSAADQDAIQRSEETKAKAADLVRELYAREAWIDTAKSVHIRLERRTEYSDEARRRDAGKPKHGLFYERRSTDGLQPYSTEEVFAWDTTRALHREAFRSPGGSLDGLARTRVWNGELAIHHSSSPMHDQTTLDDGYQTLFHVLSQLAPWGDPHGHNLWWQPREFDEDRAEEYRAPEDFEYVGQQDVGGRMCHVVQSRAGRRRYYIGVADGLRYRFEWFAMSHDVELMRKVGGEAIRTHRDWWTWLDSLAPEERRRAERALAVAQFDPQLKSVDNTLDHYREVAPGCWLPFHLVSKLYNWKSSEPSVEWTAEHRVIEAAVDQPLADELFHFEVPEDSRVSDARYDPVIVYPYRKEQTEADRVALVEATRRRQAEAQREFERLRETINSRVGQQPPPLPDEGWLHGKPLAWEQLGGKVVLLHFWDTNCPPCESEMPHLQKLHEEAGGPIVVIGIHRATDDLSAVRKKLDKLGAKYPVLVDSAKENGQGFGQLHEWFGNSWWPNSVVIDKNATFVAHGFLADVLRQVRALADKRY